ncbi:hypothetical protein [Desulfurococcus amylolyticus]|uniref:hypothetical protein n=1 Tax=Desulfurococcus amylolyticus TaxID=94694 RepID=UPI000A52C98D|nr:hypothetical protein [Desulfurococcus amylolyticus]
MEELRDCHRFDGKDHWASIYFKKVVDIKKSKTITTVDINFDNATLAVFSRSGGMLKLKRFKTSLKRILTHSIWVERI